MCTPDRLRFPGGRTRPGKLLLAGPRVIENDVVGGTKVLFESVVAELQGRAQVNLRIISTARPRALRGRFTRAWVDATCLFRTLARTWRHAAWADLIVWFVSPRAALLGGPFVWLVCALRRRPLCVRLFGGDFDVSLEEAPAAVRFMARRTFLRADLLLVETRRSAERLGAASSAAWMPNTRNLPTRQRAYRAACRRLLFLSMLQPEKGLRELLAAAPRLPHGVRLSIFGSETTDFGAGDLEDAPDVAYGGVVPPERVPEVLEDHDAVVLPSHSEGYPGVVIEAFQMGLPVIVSRLPSLQELVTEGRDGLFVAPGSVDSLVKAVTRLCSDDDLFRRLRSGALQTGERYRSAGAAATLEALCRRAAAGQAVAGPPR